MISKENKYDNEKESSNVKVIKLISLTFGISLILTTFTTILYQDLKPMFKKTLSLFWIKMLGLVLA